MKQKVFAIGDVSESIIVDTALLIIILVGSIVYFAISGVHCVCSIQLIFFIFNIFKNIS